jgi:hypothetical protein
VLAAVAASVDGNQHTKSTCCCCTVQQHQKGVSSSPTQTEQQQQQPTTTTTTRTLSMGRVGKRGATTSWDANHAALYQRGFRELGWDPLETKGTEIKGIIDGAISTDGDFESLRWLFSKTQGGEKDNNNNLYYHYKAEASEYITQLARIGIRSMCYCLRRVSFSVLSLSRLTCPSLLLPLQKSFSRTVLFRVDD